MLKKNQKYFTTDVAGTGIKPVVKDWMPGPNHAKCVTGSEGHNLHKMCQGRTLMLAVTTVDKQPV